MPGRRTGDSHCVLVCVRMDRWRRFREMKTPLINSWPAHVKEFRFWALRKKKSLSSTKLAPLLLKKWWKFPEWRWNNIPTLPKKIGPKFGKKLLDLFFSHILVLLWGSYRWDPDAPGPSGRSQSRCFDLVELTVFFSFCCLPSITINLVMNLKDFWILILGGFFKKRNHFHSEHMDVQIISHNHNLLICKRAIKILISKAPF